MVSLGKDYFEFIFTSLDGLSAVRSIGFWNLSPGFYLGLLLGLLILIHILCNQLMLKHRFVITDLRVNIDGPKFRLKLREL
jgi:hypothetical protein